MADNPVQMRFYAIARTPDNKVKVGPDMGGRKHKSLFIVYLKRGPRFKKKTPQQEVISQVGRFCGEIISGKFEGKGEMWVKRKKAYKVCVRKIFEKSGYDLNKVLSILNDTTRKEIEEALSKL